MIISIYVSAIVLLITSIGISLVQTDGVFNKVKIPCIVSDSDSQNIINDNNTQEVLATTGSFANLHCNASQERWDRDTCVVWKRNNYSLPRVEGVLRIGLTLQFNEIKPTDRGKYFCVLCSNKECTEGVRTGFDLQVDEQRPPKDLNMEGPLDTKVQLHGTAYFFCYFNYKAPDKPELTWWRVLGDTGKIEAMNATDWSGTNQSLFVENIQKKDAGYYTCQAKTSLGGAQAKTAQLIVDNGWMRKKKIATITLGTLAGLAISVMVANFLKWFYDRLKKKMKQRTKKVFSVQYNEENGVKIPEIKMQLVQTQGELIGNGYELPYFENDVPRENITIGEKLGEGCFGCVYQAEVKDLLVSGVTSIVAVKKLPEGYTDKDMMDLLHEVAVMKIIGKHHNIINLLGCCTAGGELMVIVECALNGNLKKYLEGFRHYDTFGRVLERTSEELFDLVLNLINFSLQIACGMEYLASMKCVHRDLAARNILIDLSLTMKICDFGLARGVNAADYYRQKNVGAVPFRWLAPESLSECRYDSQSDVWSYGILLWEIFTLGLLPYHWAQERDILGHLRDGYRLERPENCPLSVYKTMKECWNYIPRQRPKFSDLVQRWNSYMTPEGLESLSQETRAYPEYLGPDSEEVSPNEEEASAQIENKGYALFEMEHRFSQK